MENKITIIEGPPPTFEAVAEDWVFGLTDTQFLSEIALTRLRTFNGPSLVERCQVAWQDRRTICLEFRTPEGLVSEVPIIAARFVDTDDGHVLILWVRIPNTDVELEMDYEDDLGDSDDDDSDLPDLLI